MSDFPSYRWECYTDDPATCFEVVATPESKDNVYFNVAGLPPDLRKAGAVFGRKLEGYLLQYTVSERCVKNQPWYGTGEIVETELGIVCQLTMYGNLKSIQRIDFQRDDKPTAP